MKIVLVQPPVQDFYETDIRLQPVGLCYLKAAAEKYLHGVSVIVKDYHAGLGRTTIPVPEELAYLKEYYPVPDRSPFSAFHQYYHFGHSFEKIEEDLHATGPDVVGISSLFTAYHREALEVARRAKERLGVPVIMGGAHVSTDPRSALSHHFVDFVIRGEGERPFVELIQFLTGSRNIRDVSGLGYKRGGKVHLNTVGENFLLDELPFPDLSDLQPERYQMAGKPLAFIISSRGCPHRCAFCSVHSTFGYGYRRRSSANILKEIEQRYHDGVRVIDFEDDNLTFQKDEFMELCRLLAERFVHSDIEFTAMNGISYMSLDDETLEAMSRAGFSRLNLSLVSDDDRICSQANRPHDPDRYAKVVSKASELGFKTVSYQILGLPGDTVGNMVHTLAAQARLPVLLGASPFYLVPGSPLAKGIELSRDDYIKARLTALTADERSLDRADIYTLFITARIINFLKGLDIPGNMSLESLMALPWNDNRTRTGMKILELLIDARSMHFWTRKGMVENRKFRPGLFERAMSEAGRIACMNGSHIELDMKGGVWPRPGMDL